MSKKDEGNVVIPTEVATNIPGAKDVPRSNTMISGGDGGQTQKADLENGPESEKRSDGDEADKSKSKNLQGGSIVHATGSTTGGEEQTISYSAERIIGTSIAVDEAFCRKSIELNRAACMLSTTS